MNSDLLLRELAFLAGTATAAKHGSIKARQKQMQRLHVAAFRRAVRRLRKTAASPDPAAGKSL